MIKIENVEVFGWEAVIRGMRNPMNSWDKSDTVHGTYWGKIDGHECIDSDGFAIGANDLKLMKSLVKSGSDHRKFMRMINVSCDIIAPMYWWKEYDTYHVGTVTNSCSTMHKIADKEFIADDFSHEQLLSENTIYFAKTLERLNNARNQYLKTKDKIYWWQMIQLLPMSYNQRRTVQLNYEVLHSINRIGRRKNHKLDEWRDFCKWVDTLPYAKELLNEEIKTEDEKND